MDKAPTPSLLLATTGFWLNADIEPMLATVQPYEGPDEWVIEDLTDEEWDRFVTALRE